MNDTPTPPKIDKDMEEGEKELDQIAQGIIDEALAEIKLKYDVGGETPKPYHNSLHTQEVMARIDRLIEETDWNEIFRKLATTEEMNSLKRVLKMAAAAHDVIQDYSPGQDLNEIKSSIWLRGKMEDQFFQTEIDWAITAILATITKIEGQTPEQRHLKQNLPEGQNIDPLTRFCAQLLCDADLGNLGSEWDEYWRNVVALFKEVYPKGTLENWRDFLNLQTALLQNHRYNTDAGEKLFSEVNRERNKQRVEGLLRNAEALGKSFEEAMS